MKLQVSHSVCAQIEKKSFYEDKRLEILRKLCEWKGVEIIEGEVCPVRVFISAENA